MKGKVYVVNLLQIFVRENTVEHVERKIKQER
jgi:hypothetical protein